MYRHLLQALAAAGVACAASCACLADEINPEPAAPTVIAGNRIAYVTAHGYGEQRRFELVTTDAEGGNAQVVIAARDPLMSPAWSPDGRSLAYVGYAHGSSGIFVVDLETRSPRMVLQERGVNGAPAWSPDGQSLAVSLSFGSNADIYVVNLRTGVRRRLTDHPAIDTEPAWSPDGSEIAFTSDRSGLAQVYIVKSTGGEARRVTFEGKKNMRPSYSPDGAALAVVNYSGPRSRIGLLDLRSRALAYVSDGPMDESPSFAPDGGKLIYADVHAANLSVVTTGRRLLRRFPQQGDVHEVAWSAMAARPVRPSSDAVIAAPVPERAITQEFLPTSLDSP